MTRLVAWLAIGAGGLLAAVAACWLLITSFAVAYGLGEFQGRTPASTIFLNYLPIAAVGGVPIVAGWLLLRFGLKRLRAGQSR